MSEFWILVATIVVGFILTWIICCKPVGESYWKGFDMKPNVATMINPYDAEKEELRRKVYALERELRCQRYDRPIEVNLDVRVEANE